MIINYMQRVYISFSEISFHFHYYLYLASFFLLSCHKRWQSTYSTWKSSACSQPAQRVCSFFVRAVCFIPAALSPQNTRQCIRGFTRIRRSVAETRTSKGHRQSSMRLDSIVVTKSQLLIHKPLHLLSSYIFNIFHRRWKFRQFWFINVVISV